MENGMDSDISLEHSTPVEKHIQDNLNQFYKDKNQIEQRLQQLDEEWDIERALQLGASVATLSAVVMSVTQNRRWLAFPVIISGFLINHALGGWAPPLPVLRSLGFRNRAEIDKEKFALKALRGDFDSVLPVPNSVWGAVNK